MPDPVTGGVAAGGAILGGVSQDKALDAQKDALKDAGGLTQEGLDYQKQLYQNLMKLYGDIAQQQMNQTQGFYQDYRRNINPYLMGGGAAYNQFLGQLGLPMQSFPQMGLYNQGGQPMQAPPMMAANKTAQIMR